MSRFTAGARATLFGFLCLIASWAARAERPPSPIGVAATLEQRAGVPWVRLDFQLPPEHVLYAERLKFQSGDGTLLAPSKRGEPIVAVDKATGHETRLYNHAFVAELKLEALPMELIVKFQGCSNSACYFPEKRLFKVTAAGVTAETSSPPQEAVAVADMTPVPSRDWQAEVSGFKILARETGYLNPRDFLAFLDRAQSGHAAPTEPMARYRELGLMATLCLIFLGGIGLNLTPCVLPLIPINLAIMGAGVRARSRWRGFGLGAAYGSGMALVYGVLGLVVVLTGSKFGTLNSTVWFNAAVALVFAVLALAMFDLINLDFSRFQGGARKATGAKSQVVLAFSLGAVAALLAGACVAPVVISVLLLATQLYGQGQVAGLLLPFLLGLGMAAPWPFAGAGLTFLPKPGKWMVWVKYVFGVLIFAFAAYYGHLAYNLFENQRRTTTLAAAPSTANSRRTDPNETLVQALHKARQEGRPVFMDFSASWCKNCLAMDKTVFNQIQVQERLSRFVVVQYEAEQPNESPAREVLDRFGVLGLPTYVVLEPKP